MCLGDDYIWSAIPDIDAISALLANHLPIIYKKALDEYILINDTTNPNTKLCLETLISTIKFFMEGDELFTLYVYDRIRKYIT